MTPTEFRIALLRLGLTPPQLLARLHELGWSDLGLAAVHSWAAKRGANTRQVPGYVVAIMTLLAEHHLEDCSDDQLHAEIARRRTEPAPNARYLYCPSDTSS